MSARVTRLECELADARRTSAHCLRCEASLSAAAALRSESYSLRETCEALQRQVRNVEGDLARVKEEAEQALELEHCQSLAATDARMEIPAEVEVALDVCKQRAAEEQGQHRALQALLEKSNATARG